MLLNRSLYEALPYAYIAAGSAVVVLLDSPWAWLPGALLYIAGAHIWILRAQYRARAKRAQQPPARVPLRLYEAAPFLYIFAALVCLGLYLRFDGGQSLPLTLAAAVMFFGAGLGGWIMRSLHRRYHAAGSSR